MSIEQGGYRDPVPSELSEGIIYYLGAFRLHANEVASVEAALSHRMPIVAEFTPRASRE